MSRHSDHNRTHAVFHVVEIGGGLAQSGLPLDEVKLVFRRCHCRLKGVLQVLVSRFQIHIALSFQNAHFSTGRFRRGKHIFGMAAPVTIIAVLTGRHRQIVLDDCCQNFLPVDILVVLFGILFRMHDLQKLLLSLFCTAHASCQKIDVLGVFDSAFGEIPVERTSVIEIFPAEIAVDRSSLLVPDTLSGLGLAVELPFRHDHFCLVSIGAGIQRRDGIGVVFQQVEDGERIFDLCLFFCKFSSQHFFIMLGIGQASHIAQKREQDIVNADLKAWFKLGGIGIGSVCILRLKNRTEQVAKKPCGSFVGKLLPEKEQHIAVLFLV